MKRKEFVRIGEQIFSEIEGLGLGYWQAQSFPWLSEKTINGLVIQAEVVLLESTPGYMHILVTLFANCYAGLRLPWDPLRPVSKSFILDRGPSLTK